MKTLALILAAILAVHAARAQQPKENVFSIIPGEPIRFHNVGLWDDQTGGGIIISLKDGSVRFVGSVKPDEAALLFWEAVTRTFPEARQRLRESEPAKLSTN